MLYAFFSFSKTLHPVHLAFNTGNAEALDRWGGKTKRHPISYFLSKTSAKNFHSQIVYIKIRPIASQMWDVFETVYVLCIEHNVFNVFKSDSLILMTSSRTMYAIVSKIILGFLRLFIAYNLSTNFVYFIYICYSVCIAFWYWPYWLHFGSPS